MADFSAEELATSTEIQSAPATAGEVPAEEFAVLTSVPATAGEVPMTPRLSAPEPDITLPIISGFSPLVGSSIPRTQVIAFDVTDDLGLFSVIVVEAVADTGKAEIIHDGVGFNTPFTGSKTVIPNGFHFSFQRTGAGWPTAGLIIRIRAFDEGSNEATPQNYGFTITNPLDPVEHVLHFKMRARDSICPVQPAYVYWEVSGTPDMTGAECPPANLPCGTTPTTDLVDFAIALEWEEI